MERIYLPKGAWTAIQRVMKSAKLDMPAGHVQQILNEIDHAKVEPVPEEPLVEKKGRGKP